MASGGTKDSKSKTVVDISDVISVERFTFEWQYFPLGDEGNNATLAIHKDDKFHDRHKTWCAGWSGNFTGWSGDDTSQGGG
jgi:hypothetical protein